jgi:hypothetical protein
MSMEAVLSKRPTSDAQQNQRLQLQLAHELHLRRRCRPASAKGSVLHFQTWYDNTANNKANPDPNQWVGWAYRTVDEMGPRLAEPSPTSPTARIQGGTGEARGDAADNQPASNRQRAFVMRQPHRIGIGLALCLRRWLQRSLPVTAQQGQAPARLPGTISVRPAGQSVYRGPTRAGSRTPTGPFGLLVGYYKPQREAGARHPDRRR